MAQENIQEVYSISKTEELQNLEESEGKKPSILLIDDTAENLTIIIGMLKDCYSVKIANSAQKALSFLEHFKPDLILLDVLMPQMNGYELCKKIKQNPDLKDIPIIFLTVLEDEEDIVNGFKLGAVDYVTKPVSPYVLKARVNTHVRLKKFQDKLLEDIKEKDELIIKQSKMATLGEMFENITHQWKQPIATISMSSANVRADLELDNFSQEGLLFALDSIDLSIKHLGQTMDDFKDFLHEDSEKEWTSLSKVVQKAINLTSSKLKNRSIDVELFIEDFEIKTYKNDLIQILMNILNNAIEACEKKDSERKLKIQLSKEENKIKLTICDNCGGIESDPIDKIFSKYFTTKLDKKGSGIGLYMSKILIQKRIGGEIEARNENSGACFEISIPNPN